MVKEIVILCSNIEEQRKNLAKCTVMALGFNFVVAKIAHAVIPPVPLPVIVVAEPVTEIKKVLAP